MPDVAKRFGHSERMRRNPMHIPFSIPRLAFAVSLFFACRASAPPPEPEGSATPPPTVDKAEFPKPLAILPTKLINGHTLFEGTLGGVALDIVFDTGMVEGILVSESVAKAAGLKKLRDFSFGGIGHGAKTVGYITEPATLTFGDISLNSQAIVFPEDSQLGKAFCGLQAVMGYTLYSRYLLRVRPQVETMELYPNDANYHQPGEQLDLRLDTETRKLSTTVSVSLRGGRAEKRDMLIDTGNATEVILFEAAPEQVSTIQRGGHGASGLHIKDVGRIESLSLGSTVFTKPIVAFDDTGKDGSGIHNLSNQILTKFETVYDLKRKKLVLLRTDPNALPTSFIGNGILWKNSGCGETKEIARVFPHTVAARAGLETGDTLSSIEGESEIPKGFIGLLQSKQPVAAQFRRGQLSLDVVLSGEDRLGAQSNRRPMP